MGLIVQKYGGTSVRDIERIRSVAERVGRMREQGHDVIVVVSAMAGETDKLVKWAGEFTEIPDEREYDLLLSSGERITSALLAIALQTIGYPAQSFTGRQAGIITDSAHGKARIARITGERIQEALAQGKIAVVAGFQGIDEKSDVSTLGRGGSDTSAVALAAAFHADLCEIYTDVDGVYTTDPNLVPEARKLEKISYDEMLELASLGAKVLQTRSVEFAKKYNVPLMVRSSFNEHSGTLVTQEESDMEKVVVAGIAYNKGEAKVSIIGIPDRPGVAKRIFRSLADANVVVDMIIQNIGKDGLADLTFTVSKEDRPKAEKIMQELKNDLSAREIRVDEDIVKVAIVGVGMRSHTGVAAKMFEILADVGINIQMISTSEIKISCILAAKYLELAVRELHKAFELDKEQTLHEKRYPSR
ncbi:MAG: aspartate kinase [Nitrospirae bacterium CG_4_9_14_3_um_filter_53_35]|nr:MAG: aspartate kinase [Nitrospirae bacterium CG2_30_53_67]PIS38522.1 MAG: aspartate kinase [Nitrospirae bacterium CG08_land_8_20_14_0_20_52_24]PIV85138.1 MAG: aspartate kinase [Nitrospirae bacterium CG17_big_fil_post_rev_8_21_14_2_50_50_9]PIW84605.1 MAG: aspartate kinase [Nitrospirae bacterium CG_4_8_14_3_um_filter_50_41]PIX85540.1 MAG: aspartate kinase [Nitrospirae bacterium CG_4_10_14_3_um_filter_53_41]PJA74131.1 MAG: aspartate kinase [Nitrospirae bacterium CG_4_9_14_3_um_filter_53_35]